MAPPEEIPSGTSTWRRFFIRSCSTVGLLPLFLLVYFVGALTHDVTKPLWFDELITFYASRLPTPAAIYAALLHSVDGQPPGTDWITHYSLLVFGQNSLAARLPETVAIGLACVLLYLFVRKRTAPLYAFIAVLIPVLTLASDFSSEARPYGFILLSGMLGLYIWQIELESPGKWTVSLALSAAISMGIWCHYYSALMVGPLAAGETIRAVQERKVHWNVWCALCASLWPFPVLHKLLSAEAFNSAGLIRRWGTDNLSKVYLELLGSSLLLVLFLYLLSVILRDVGRPLSSPKKGNRMPELGALVCVLLLPVAGWVIAQATKMFLARYFLMATFGLSALVSLAFYDFTRNYRALAQIVSTALMFCFINQQYPYLRRFLAHARASVTTLHPTLANATGNMPVVFQNPTTYLQCQFLAPPKLSARFLYLADPEQSRKYSDWQIADSLISNLHDYAPFNIATASYLRDSKPFYFFWTKENGDFWTLHYLLANSWALKLVSLDPTGDALFICERSRAANISSQIGSQ